MRKDAGLAARIDFEAGQRTHGGWQRIHLTAPDQPRRDLKPLVGQIRRQAFIPFDVLLRATLRSRRDLVLVPRRPEANLQVVETGDRIRFIRCILTRSMDLGLFPLLAWLI